MSCYVNVSSSCVGLGDLIPYCNLYSREVCRKSPSGWRDSKTSGFVSLCFYEDVASYKSVTKIVTCRNSVKTALLRLIGTLLAHLFI